MRQLLNLERRGKLLLPVAVLVGAALIGVSNLAYRDSTTSMTSLGARGMARAAISTLLLRLLDDETAQRGYLLTGRSGYLAPRKAASTDIEQAMLTLEAHYRDHPEQLATVKTLRTRVSEKLSETTVVIESYEANHNGPWLDLMMTDIGREKMEAVRAIAEVLLATEDARVAAERDDVYRTLRLSRNGVQLLTLLSMVALLFYARKTMALEQARMRHARDLQAERDELETAVRRRTAELTELASHLQSAREDERSRLARELHDELGALLTAAKLDLARLRRGLGPLSTDVEQRVTHLNDTIDQGVSLKRRIIEDLHPSALSHLGLVAAIEIQAREFATRANLQVHRRLQSVTLSESAQMTVYRMVQESFTNIAKYAAATEVTLTLHTEAGRVRVAVQDNGIGFDIGRKVGSSHGLTGMRYRVEAAGGELRVSSIVGQGTTIEAWLPAQDGPAADA